MATRNSSYARSQRNLGKVLLCGYGCWTSVSLQRYVYSTIKIDSLRLGERGKAHNCRHVCSRCNHHNLLNQRRYITVVAWRDEQHKRGSRVSNMQATWAVQISCSPLDLFSYVGYLIGERQIPQQERYITSSARESDGQVERLLDDEEVMIALSIMLLAIWPKKTGFARQFAMRSMCRLQGWA